jgi:hypothetical protein
VLVLLRVVFAVSVALHPPNSDTEDQMQAWRMGSLQQQPTSITC